MSKAFIAVVSLYITSISSTNGQAGYINSPSSTTCQPIPNTVPGQHDFRPDLDLGLWYVYRQTTGTCVVNSVFHYTPLVNNTMEWASGKKANIELLQQAFHASPTDSTCLNLWFVGYYTSEGAGIGLVSGPTNFTPVPDYFVTMAIDYASWGLDFVCITPNLASGVCDFPIFYVYTRTPPDQLSAAEQSAIDGKVAAVLQPYCVNFDKDVPKCPFNSSQSLCPFIDPKTTCFNDIIQGYSTLTHF